MITKEAFTKEIQEALKGALVGLTEAAQHEKVSEVLQTAEATISELLQSVSTKDEELTKSGEEKKTLLSQVEELVVKTQQLEEQLAAREAELKELDEKRASAEQRATAAESVIQEAAAVRVLESRIEELAAAKVLKSGEKLEAQKLKVSSMTDEEFASYRDELVELRADLEAVLKESANVEVEETEEDVVDVAPPAINKEEAATAGALDVELVETPSLKAKFSALGPALAKRMGTKE